MAVQTRAIIRLCIYRAGWEVHFIAGLVYERRQSIRALFDAV